MKGVVLAISFALWGLTNAAPSPQASQTNVVGHVYVCSDQSQCNLDDATQLVTKMTTDYPDHQKEAPWFSMDSAGTAPTGTAWAEMPKYAYKTCRVFFRQRDNDGNNDISYLSDFAVGLGPVLTGCKGTPNMIAGLTTPNGNGGNYVYIGADRPAEIVDDLVSGSPPSG